VCLQNCRVYQEYHENLTAERLQFRRVHPRKRGCRVIPYPPNLPEPLRFDEWLNKHVSEELATNPVDVACLYKAPLRMATEYRSMWAFGNHFRVASVEKHLITCDFGVAATFSQHSGLRDKNLVMANLEYVGE